MRFRSLVAGCVFLCTLAPVAAEPARLLRAPAASATRIAFVYANDVWIVGREGGEARRLTTFEGAETAPHFSPDGKLVAFSGEYDGNVDVYVVPVEGGEPRRLTWHPMDDVVSGWTPDGRVLFASGRDGAPRPWPKLWTIALDAPMPQPLPLPRAADGSVSPDGRLLAYQKIAPWEGEWRNYRGGQANPIRVANLQSLSEEKLPWDGSDDRSPVWLGDTIFFLSDRDYAMNVWAWDTRAKKLTQRTRFKDLDCKNLGGGAGLLVFENGGWLWTLDAQSGEPRKLDVTIAGDFPWARPHWIEAAKHITSARLSPTGKRVLFGARGEVFTVPVEKGDVRNLTRSSGVADRDPVWSPDGSRIAWFSDEGGEYHIVIAGQRGENPRNIEIPGATFFYTPRWSPDGKRLAFGDADRNLWVVDADGGKPVKIDSEGFAHPQRHIYPEWSPDSRWIAYSRRLKNQFSAVFVYSLEDKKTRAVTDGLSNAHSPAWGRDGKHLYFLGSTDYGRNVGWLDLSSYAIPVNYAIWVAVLPRDEPSPLAPESDDEESPADEEADEKKQKKESKADEKAKQSKEGEDDEDEQEADAEEPPRVAIDFDGLSQRILALDVPARPYGDLTTGPEGTLFFTEAVLHEDGLVLHRYSAEEREAEEVEDEILGYALSADGKKLLLAKPEQQFFVIDSDAELEPGEGKVDLHGLPMRLDPPAEWKQMFREAWRFQRDYFYVENVHGLDLDWAWRTYSPWLDHVRHRADLTHLLDILGGETAVGHSFTGGGDEPEIEPVPIGLLGADFVVVDGRYKISRIYSGENWNPELRAPLAGPGIDARTGDYLIAVDGVPLTAEDNLYAAFEHGAGRQIMLTLNSKPAPEGAREVKVVPVESEGALRQRAWIEDNRRRVAELSGNRLAYVWVPDTGEGGHTQFTRYYFAQLDKRGVIVDERFNHGGYIADYIVDLLGRRLMGYFNNPVGERQPWTAPNGAIWGPKVMLINEMSGSGGDMLPYMFRELGLGPLVGTRTWGGLVGIWDVPDLVDGGFITAPRGGFYDVHGKWAVENEGVEPDIEVEENPALARQGRDPQLERAVEIALERLKTEGIELLPQPPDPVRVRRPD